MTGQKQNHRNGQYLKFTYRFVKAHKDAEIKTLNKQSLTMNRFFSASIGTIVNGKCLKTLNSFSIFHTDSQSVIWVDSRCRIIQFIIPN